MIQAFSGNSIIEHTSYIPLRFLRHHAIFDQNFAGQV